MSGNSTSTELTRRRQRATAQHAATSGLVHMDRRYFLGNLGRSKAEARQLRYPSTRARSAAEISQFQPAEEGRAAL